MYYYIYLKPNGKLVHKSTLFDNQLVTNDYNQFNHKLIMKLYISRDRVYLIERNDLK